MKINRSIIMYLGFFGILLLFFNQLFSQQNKKEITVTGTIDAVTFDSNDNVIEIAIAVEKQINEDEIDFMYYYVVNDKKGKELFGLIGEVVEVTGKTTVDKEGKMYITVLMYTVIPEEDNVDLDVNDEDM